MRRPTLRPSSLTLALCALLACAVFADGALSAKRRTPGGRRRAARIVRPKASEIPPPERAAVPPEQRPARRLPPIVFVSRQPVAGEPGAVPGLGPHHRTLAPGGRLMVRDTLGQVRALLPTGALHDVADPSVSFDGRRIAFAGTTHPDSAWRIWLVNADGTGLAPLTRSDRDVNLAPLGAGAAAFARYDDFDPCWITPHRVVFASTRFPLMAQYGSVPASNLYMVRDDGGPVARLTTERNGAEEPALDGRTGRLVYTRWWYNRHRPSALEPGGLTTVAARAIGDSINLWQAVSVTPDSSDLRLEAGDPLSRRGETIYQPAPLPSGCLAGVTPTHLAFSPRSGGTALQIFGLEADAGRGGLPRAIGAARRLAGPAVSEQPADAYHDARGLAAPGACAPVGLGDDGVVFSYDPGGRGDYGLWVIDEDGERLERVFDQPGTLELDAAPLVARAPQLVVTDEMLDRRGPRPGGAPLPLDAAAVMAASGTDRFTFHCLNLFANAPLDTPLPDAPSPAQGLTIRFFANVPGARDTAVLVREAPVSPDGEILVGDLPPGVPMFEQIVAADGRVLMSAHGPAHVAGLNATSADERRCIGCHTGHSALPVPRTPDERPWFNASPAATVTASGTAPGTAAPSAVVDRRTRGSAAREAWTPDRPEGAWVRLQWPAPLVIRKLGLHAVRPATASGGTTVIRRSEIVLMRAGVEVGRRIVDEALSPEGTFVGFDPVEADALELRVLATLGPRPVTPRPLLAEIETIARLPGGP